MSLAEQLVAIRVRLLGGPQTAAELGAINEEMAATGKAAAGSAAKTKGASAGIASSLARIGAAGKKMSSAGRVISKSVTLPLVALVGVSAKMASDFDANMEMIHTQSGASQKEVTVLSKKVLELAKVSPQGPNDLAQALYRLEGAGLRGSKAMDALRMSSQFAAIGNANVEDTAKTLTQVFFSGIKGVGTFRHTVGELNATIGAGDLRMNQLVDAIGVGVLPAAKAAGLSLSDVTGAMGVFGDETSNVSGYMAQFATSLHFLTNPGVKASAAFDQIGLSQKKLVEDLQKPRGMLNVLTEIHDRVAALPGGTHGPEAQQVLGDILPGGRGRILVILMNQLDRYRQKMDQIKRTNGQFDSSVKKAMDQPLNRLKVLWSQLQVSLINFGNVVLPVLVPALTTLADAFTGILDAFTQLPAPIQKVIGGFILLVAVLGPILIFFGAIAGAVEALGGALIALGVIGEGGGALALFGEGGLLAAAAGFLPEIAAAGAAVGVVYGLSKAYDALFGSAEKMSPTEARLKQGSEHLTAALHRQSKSLNTLVSANRFVVSAHHRAKDAAEAVRKAEERLLSARKHYGRDSRQAILAEARLAQVTHRSAAAARAARTADRARGAVADAVKVTLKATVLAEKQQLANLHKTTKARLAQVDADTKAHAPAAQIADDLHRYYKSVDSTQKVQKQYSDTLQKAGDQIGPKYANWLANAKLGLLRYGPQLKTVDGTTRVLGTHTQAYTTFLQGAADAANRARGNFKQLNREATNLDTTLSSLPNDPLANINTTAPGIPTVTPAPLGPPAPKPPGKGGNQHGGHNRRLPDRFTSSAPRRRSGGGTVHHTPVVLEVSGRAIGETVVTVQEDAEARA